VRLSKGVRAFRVFAEKRVAIEYCFIVQFHIVNTRKERKNIHIKMGAANEKEDTIIDDVHCDHYTDAGFLQLRKQSPGPCAGDQCH
jgi:hypothetical protein